MRDLNSSSLSGLISQYLHGNWSFFNNDRPHLGVLDADAKAIALILLDLTPGRVFHQETELSSRILLTPGLSSVCCPVASLLWLRYRLLHQGKPSSMYELFVLFVHRSCRSSLDCCTILSLLD